MKTNKQTNQPTKEEEKNGEFFFFFFFFGVRFEGVRKDELGFGRGLGAVLAIRGENINCLLRQFCANLTEFLLWPVPQSRGGGENRQDGVDIWK